jgi:hypothetical protein
MRLTQYITEKWVFPDNKTLKSDFSEYKHKEDYKWKRRAEQIGARFPLFADFDDFVNRLKKARVVNLTRDVDNKITNRSHTSSIESLKSLVGSYSRPRDVDRIIQGIMGDDKIPFPIVLKGNRGMWIMAGNTRLDTAFLLGNKPKVLMVDVSDEKFGNGFN